MSRFLDFLFFSFICLLAVFGNVPGTTTRQLNQQVNQAGLFMAVCLYFLGCAGAIALAQLFGLQLKQTWVTSVLLAGSGLVVLLGFPVWYSRRQRPLLVLQQYAPLVEHNKWFFPFSAVVFFGSSFMLFVVALQRFVY